MLEDILDAYDREERIAVHAGDGVREETPHVVRHVRPPGRESFLSYVCLSDADADRVIREEIAFFAGSGRSFRWKHFERDRPADLLDRLRKAGFKVGEPDSLVAVDLRLLPAALRDPPSHDVRSVASAAAWSDFLAVARAAWPDHALDIERDLAARREERPEEISLWVAYLRGQPSAAGWLTTTKGSRFAGLFGGSTLPDARGLGLYRALVAARVREAGAAGRRFAVVDAGAMSHPILERLGFSTLTRTWPCIWSAE